MRLSFDSIEEVKEFVAGLKGTRGKKGEGESEAATGTVPPPMQPPAGGVASFNPTGFAPQGQPAGQPGAFPAAGASGPDPAVLALAQRINARIDWCLTPAPNGGGQQADNILAWFRSQLGGEAANYTMDQIKQVALPRASVPTLENIAKLMAA